MAKNEAIRAKYASQLFTSDPSVPVTTRLLFVHPPMGTCQRRTPSSATLAISLHV